MMRAALALLASVAADPAAGQRHGEHAGYPPSKQHADPHAGHAGPKLQTDPHAAHAVPDEPEDPHAGHQMPEQQSDPHAAHGTTTPAPPVLPAPAEALSGPRHAADAIFGSEAMAPSRKALRSQHGDMPASKLLIDKLEIRSRDGRDSWHLDGQAWFGGDVDKLWLKGEAEGELGHKLEHAEAQVLWSHAIDPWFDLQSGVRYDPQSGPDRAHLVVGIQGLAPNWWEVDGAIFLSSKGELTARAEVEYDLRITQKLILQPQAEINLSAQRVRELSLGSGLTSADVSLRLRYQVRPTLAPYLGVSYERAFGGTRRMRKADGEDAAGLSVLSGVRFWF